MNMTTFNAVILLNHFWKKVTATKFLIPAQMVILFSNTA